MYTHTSHTETEGARRPLYACRGGGPAFPVSLGAIVADRPPRAPPAAAPLPQQRRFGMMGTTDNPGGMAANATPEELAALPEAVIVDVRSPDEVAKGPAVPGSLNLPWDRDADVMPLDGLPEDFSVPIFTH